MSNMIDSDVPALDEILALVAELVPDIPKPSEIFAEIRGKDRMLWIEGWCDGCIASEGFPSKNEGMLQEKLAYIREATPKFLRQRAEEKGMDIMWSGFIPLEDKEFLYGVSWAVFTNRI
ncbi:MAG: hypothetical protein ACTSRQ_16260 [Candidatus Thorarchaeota archaeon]